MKARLIVVDDHEVVRQGARGYISRTGDLEVVAEAGDGVEAERVARSVAADLLILDVTLPGRRGLQILESLRADGIDLPVLFFTMCPPDQYLEYARRAGAQGFVGKDASLAELLGAARRILAGGTAFADARGEGLDSGPDETPFARISRRESEVLHGLLRGDTLLQISARLNISANSVTTYRRRLFEKLGVRNNAELVALSVRHGYR